MATANNAWPIPASTDYVKNGYDAIDDLGNAIDTSVGTGLLAWQSYSPTLSGGTTPAWSNGNATYDAKYCKIGKTVTVSILFTLGSTTGKGNASPIFTLPAGLPARVANVGIAPARFNRSASYYGFVIANTTTTMQLFLWNSASTYLNADVVTSAVPGAWTTGDYMSFQFTYETSA